MKKTAILIPVFNHLDYTRKCIEALLHQLDAGGLVHSYLPVVIDDGSTDGTAGWMRGNHPEIPLLEGDGNLWWSGGVNLGARHAIGQMKVDYLLLWNNDVYPEEGYFREIDRLVDSLDGRTIAGSKILYLDRPTLVWSYGGKFDPRTGAKPMIAYNEEDSPALAQVLEVDWLPGMGTLIPAAVPLEIGYWDAEHFPQYHGDSDYTFRAKKAGFSLKVYPGLRLRNDKSSSGLTHGGSWKGLRSTLTSIRSNSNIRKNLLFYRRHATSPLAYAFLLRHYAKLVGGFIKWKILGFFGIRKGGKAL